MIKKTAVLLLLTILIVAPIAAFSGELDYPEVMGETAEEGGIGYLFNFAIIAAMAAVFATLVYGGFLYITSVGNAEKTQKAKKRITAAFLGLALMLLSVLIINTVNPNILDIESPSNEFPSIETEHPDFNELTGKDNIIVEENPLGYFLKNELNSLSQREKILENLFVLRNIMREEREFNPIVTGISGMNKYFLGVSKNCSCSKLEARCASTRILGVPLGCDGDPCKEDDVVVMEEIMEENNKVTEKLLNIRSSLIEEQEKIETNIRRFQELEQRMVDCQNQGITTLRQQIDRFDMFESLGMGMITKTHKEMDIGSGGGSSLTFYCSIGGTLMEAEVFPRNGVPLTGPLSRVENIGRVNCPYEYNVGEIYDSVREATIIQMVKISELINIIEDMISEIQNFSEYASSIGIENCRPVCNCIPNPLVWMPPYNPCLQVVGTCTGQASPYGGDAKEGGDRGKMQESVEKIKELEEKIQNTIYSLSDYMVEVSLMLGERVVTNRETNVRPSPDTVLGTGFMAEEDDSYLILEVQENWVKVRNDLDYDRGEKLEEGVGWISASNLIIQNSKLDDIEESLWECYTPEEETSGDAWAVLNAPMAIGNYSPNNLILYNPHPRNIFCCSIPQYPVEDKDPLPHYEYNIIPAERFTALNWNESKGCIQGWNCEDTISLPNESNYTQYDDASEKLKQQISCMREELDNIQKRRKIGVDDSGEVETPIGKISYISDHRLYSPINSCSFTFGNLDDGGCSFSHETVYGQNRISPHYGGNECNDTEKSFAITFSDIEYAEHIIKAAKSCNSQSYISYEIPYPYSESSAEINEKIGPHIQVSIAGSYNCGTY